MTELAAWMRSAVKKRVWVGGLMAFCAASVAASDHAPAAVTKPTVPVTTVSTNASTNQAALLPTAHSHAPEEINPSLRQHSESLGSSNIVEVLAPTKTNSNAQGFQTRLDMAIQLHRAKNSSQAKHHLVELLGSEAPPEIKKTAMLEIAMIAQDENQPARALQVFSQYISRFSRDPSIPEIMLRQGLLYRQMGANNMAIGKFYGVMSAALSLKASDLQYHRRIVLQAQTEIADTYYMQGSFKESAEFLERILKLDSPEINHALIRFKLIRSRSALELHSETVQTARSFLDSYPGAPERAEVRFLLAKSLKALAQPEQALKELSLLLQEQQSAGAEQHSLWVYWQQRIGNEIANQLYREGDYLNALNLYQTLATLDESMAWKLPVLYQIALVYERLHQPAKAIENYAAISARRPEAGAEISPELKTIFEMAQWRGNLVAWQNQINSGTTNAAVQPTTPASTSP